jgi:hypothetical protein
MRTSYKVAIGFVGTIALFMILRLAVPDQPAVASIPGVLFTGYIARLCYEYFRTDKPDPDRI